MVQEWMSPDIDCLCPLRSQSYIVGEKVLANTYDEDPFCTGKSITLLDHHDVKRCDLLLVNYLDAKKVSIGTVMEQAWAYAYGHPVVVVMEENNPHFHCMVEETSTMVFDDLMDACFAVKTILLP